MSNYIYPSRIIHFIHNHSLELTTSNQVGPNSLCAKCKQRNAISVSGSIPPSCDFYVCRSCDYFIHVPCIQLPSHLIKHAAPPNNMPDNSRLAASRTVAVQQNPPQNYDRAIVRRRGKWMKRLKYLRLAFALARLASGDPTSPVEIILAFVN